MNLETRLKPPIHWYGGKTLQTKNILPYIPEHTCYVEPYGGSGAVLFAKEACKVEIYNDLHKDVVNLYRVIRDHFEEFRNRIACTPYSRSDLDTAYMRLQLTRKFDTDVEVARNFFVIARQSFSGRHNVKPGWSVSKKTNHATAWMNAIDGLAEVHNRLRTVCIECRPAIEVIRQYEDKETFMYLDPPYMKETRKEEEAYAHEMTDNDHLEMLSTITRSDSMILLSGYHCDMYDDLLGDWRYKDFTANASAINTSASDADAKRTEVLWWNDELEVNRIGSQQYLELEIE